MFFKQAHKKYNKEFMTKTADNTIFAIILCENKIILLYTYTYIKSYFAVFQTQHSMKMKVRTVEEATIIKTEIQYFFFHHIKS